MSQTRTREELVPPHRPIRTIFPRSRELRRLRATVPGDTGTALRLAAAFADACGPFARAAVDEIAASERAPFVLTALATLASRLPYGLTELFGGTPDVA
jgi:hypothetical protein